MVREWRLVVPKSEVFKKVVDPEKKYELLKFADRHGFTLDELEQLMKEFPKTIRSFEDFPKDIISKL